MEPTETQVPQPGETPEAEKHDKPLLTVEQQIAHLKAKGVTFDLCDEEEAATYLSGKCNFFRVTAYRKLFDKHVGGECDGQYANLDFAQLRYLSSLDRRLRDVLLPMTLDLEHFEKARLLNSAEANGEDGYSVVADFMGQSAKERRYIESQLEMRRNDVYSGALIRKYRDEMPLWAFLEVVSFGTFVGLVKFCADRWGDDALLVRHYLLKKGKSIRNASAHSLCILNDLQEYDIPTERVSPVVSKAIAECGVSKRLRSKKLRSPRMVQVATLLYLYGVAAPSGASRSQRSLALAAFFDYVDENARMLDESNPAVSSIGFIRRLTDGFNLLD